MATRSNEPMAQIGRLALRQEGDLWNAYYAMPNTMEGAIFLGSIRIAAVMRDDARKQAFIDLMREVVGDTIKDTTGVQPQWPDGPQPAPEHERAGRA